MKPREFILETQRRMPFPSPDLETTYAKVESDWTSDLLPRLPKVLEKCFDHGYITEGIVFDLAANARTTLVDPCGWAILFNVGLIELIYSLARALGTRVKADESSTTIPFEETARLFQKISKGFRGATYTVPCPKFDFEPIQLEWAYGLTKDAELFILAHELGHIVRGYLDSVLPRLLKRSDPDTSELLKALSSQDHREYDADEIGFLLAMGIFGGYAGMGSESVLAARYRSAEFSMQVFRVLEHAGVRFDSTHPPALKRLEKMRSVFHSYCGDPQEERRLTNLLFLLTLVFERQLIEFDQSFAPRSSRELHIWASPGPGFAKRVSQGAQWIETIFADAGLVPRS